MELIISRNILSSINDMARRAHPKEVILLLRGKRAKNTIKVTDIVFPPFGHGAVGYSNFPAHMLPIDFSIVGTAHSHPSGNPEPSPEDINNFYGRIMLITAYPYNSQSIGAYNGRAKEIPVKVD